MNVFPFSVLQYERFSIGVCLCVAVLGHSTHTQPDDLPPGPPPRRLGHGRPHQPAAKLLHTPERHTAAQRVYHGKTQVCLVWQ